MFLSDSTLSAMVMRERDQAFCISRDWFFAQLVGPLGHGRSLYARHTIGHLPRPDTLLLPASVSPIQAAQEVQTRPPESRYHDIVVRHSADDYGTLAVADLFAEVAHTHAHLGLHDPLTGLPNRRLFLERLRGAHDRARRDANNVFGVLFVDLDDFKPINDVLGHETGDVALITVARRLQRFERDHVTAARFGGDEFGVLVDHAGDADVILELADQIARSLNRPMLLSGERMKLGASIGVALSDGQSSPENLLRNADLAMYAAKRDNKGGYAIFENEMHARASKRLQLRSQLETALERDQFEVFFQPLVALDTLQPVGMEALVRWRLPALGIVTPEQFIPLCEQTGMIVPLGTWVLETACSQVAEWRRAHSTALTLSVNISPRQLLNPGLTQEVTAALASSNLPPDALVLEVTENIFIDDSSPITERMRSIRDLGVRVALDDFGTGFSSLGYLSRLPLDMLKLDRSFVSQLSQPSQRALFRGLIELAHALDLTAVAEGIETLEQLEILRAAGCERGQGYLFSRPLDRDQIQAWLLQKLSQPPLDAAA